MFKEEFEGNWHKFKGKIQEKWGKFTHDDIARINGKYEQFLGELQKKYGYSREQAEREFRTWCESCRNKSHQNEFTRENREGNYPSKDQKFGKQSPWKSEEKNKNKNNDQDYRDKKRKAG
jgi:uncharacterized protein YjbJ (UPF0337 family)